MKPANVVLDLLRTYPGRGTTVKEIMATGALFGFTENVMRVCLSRLAAKDRIEIVKRGHYRLSEAADPVNDFVESWRAGESRRKVWVDQRWLIVVTQESIDTRGEWALNSLGFRLVTDHLWIRPDNLAIAAGALRQQLTALGLETSMMIINNGRIEPGVADSWFAYFSTTELDEAYRDMMQTLAQSMGALKNLPVEQAKRESFDLGGRAIQLLVKDPLIPAEIHDPAAREALWQVMLTYDKCGRDIWANQSLDAPSFTPTARSTALESPQAAG